MGIKKIGVRRYFRTKNVGISYFSYIFMNVVDELHDCELCDNSIQYLNLNYTVVERVVVYDTFKSDHLRLCESINNRLKRAMPGFSIVLVVGRIETDIV